ncbi:unnamed protein product, partial [Amoebophrya sp. A120]
AVQHFSSCTAILNSLRAPLGLLCSLWCFGSSSVLEKDRVVDGASLLRGPASYSLSWQVRILGFLHSISAVAKSHCVGSLCGQTAGSNHGA